MIQKYVCGFLFDLSHAYVVLIEKQAPEWQRGYWNGVGGKMEVWEFPESAMEREFEEETGVLIRNWQRFAVLETRNALVYFFSARAAYQKLITVETMEKEKVAVHMLHALPQLVIPNLNFLLPMALNIGKDLHEPVFNYRITEGYAII